MRNADKYQEIYCKYCNKMCHSLNSVKVHEAYCSNNPNRVVKIGHKSWNKGLTKDSDERVLKNSISTSNSLKKNNHQKGKPRTEEEKKKISMTMKNNPNAGGLRQGSGRGKKGWYKGIYCDSTYELAYVAYNIDHGVVFNRCPKTVCYEYQYKNQSHKYYPDFMLEDGSLVEVKGYHNEVVDLKIASVTDRPINVLYEKDLEFAFSYIKETYGVKKIEELYKMENELRAAS